MDFYDGRRQSQKQPKKRETNNELDGEYKETEQNIS